MIVITHWDINI